VKLCEDDADLVIWEANVRGNAPAESADCLDFGDFPADMNDRGYPSPSVLEPQTFHLI
jgi:hypothetical protein